MGEKQHDKKDEGGGDGAGKRGSCVTSFVDERLGHAAAHREATGRRQDHLDRIDRRRHLALARRRRLLATKAVVAAYTRGAARDLGPKGTTVVDVKRDLSIPT